MCERHHSQHRRGKLPNYQSKPRGRPRKNFTLLNDRTKSRVIEQTSQALAGLLAERCSSLSDIQEMKEALASDPLISALTDHASTKAKVGENISNTLANMKGSHFTQSLLHEAIQGIPTREAHSLPTHSVRELQQARNLSFFEFLEQRYPHGVTRTHASQEELAFITSFYRHHTCVAPPAQKGSSLLLDRANPYSRVSKLLQTRSDSMLYQMYCFAWKEAGHAEPPRSKAYLIAHKFSLHCLSPFKQLTRTFRPFEVRISSLPRCKEFNHCPYCEEWHESYLIDGVDGRRVLLLQEHRELHRWQRGAYRKALDELTADEVGTVSPMSYREISVAIGTSGAGLHYHRPRDRSRHLLHNQRGYQGAEHRCYSRDDCSLCIL